MRASDSLARVALIAVLLAPGCAWITESSKVRAEYARQVMVASERTALLEAQLEEAQARLDALDETVKLYGRNESDRIETIDEVDTEIRAIRGLLEELQFQLKTQQKYLDDNAIDRERRMVHAERRLTQVEKYLHVTPPPAPTDAELGIVKPDVTNPDGSVTHGDGSITRPDGTTTHLDGRVTAADGTVLTPATVIAPPIDTTAPPASADEAIDIAVGHMKAGIHGAARAVLQKAQEDFPGAAESAELQYRIGETFANEKDHRAAIRAFDVVVKGFPKTAWAAWAMYRQGEAFEALGRTDNAKIFYQGVVDKYASSPAAVEAKAKLGIP